MSTIYYVYIDTCTTTNKSYIGVTKHSPEVRWIQKVSDTKNRKEERNYKIINAIDKYGSDNWTHEVIYCTKCIDTVCEMEIYFIDLYDTLHNGYNSCKGGIGYPRLDKLPDSHKEAIRKGLQRAYDSGFRKPVSHDSSVRQKIREAKSTGIWKTPIGEFLSSREAAKALNTSKTNIKNWCKNPENLVTKQSPTRLPNIFNVEDVGKSLSDCGFAFVST